MDRERTILALSLGDPGQLYDLSVDKDSDLDRSVNTAGTEEHSSFSEQAWDFYQVRTYLVFKHCVELPIHCSYNFIVIKLYINRRPKILERASHLLGIPSINIL